MAFEADCGVSTVLEERFGSRKARFPEELKYLALREVPVGVALSRRASSRGTRDVVSWFALACQMAAYRGP